MRQWQGMAWVLLACGAATGCVMHFGGTSSLWGQEVETRGDKLIVDGVELPHRRWVSFGEACPGGGAARIGTASGDIDLRGGEGDAVALEVLVHSEQPDDGTVVWKDHRLVAESAAGHKVFVNAVRGSLPATLELEIQSGTGEITLQELKHSPRLYVTSGTGDIELVSCEPATLDIESGTGGVTLRDVGGQSCSVESGTGGLSLVNCSLREVRASTGTGTVEVLDSTVDHLWMESGTGDTVVSGGEVGTLEASLGTGDVIQRNGAKIGSLREN